jgi:hypothetical protein
MSVQARARVANLVSADTYRFGIVNDVSTGTSGSTDIYVTGHGGPYHLEMDGDCSSWSVTVLGLP